MDIKQLNRSTFRIVAAALLAGVQTAPGVTQMVDEQAKLDMAAPASAFSGMRSHHMLELQVLLDRARFSPGVIDGFGGDNTRRAIEAYQRANGMAVNGTADSGLLDALRGLNGSDILVRYRITEADVAGPFGPVPDGMEEMAKLETLAYESPAEALAERFHMARAFLEALNPGADFGQAGTEILVAATQGRVLEGKVARIEVDGANSTLRAYGAEDNLLATFPATVGSSEFPSPSGRMTVRTLAPDPVYYFSPEGRSWGPDRKLTISAGPNNPVGSTWIDLSEEGYGIHGTPDPRLIGKTASHGCVRLTNWDAKALGKAIEVGTVVEFI